MYLMRLDDASEYMDIEKWTRMETLLDKYEIKPIYGIIPDNQDVELLKSGKVDGFWSLMRNWQEKGWTPALHGYNHIFETNEGGINPVNKKSEFAGVELNRQKEKIRNGCEILKKNGIDAHIFFAPAHTFDKNTLTAIKEESSIRIISDTIANDIYYKDDFFFIPQQSGYCRKLPFKTVTFCYHPNIMQDDDFYSLEIFLKKEMNNFSCFKDINFSKRAFGIKDTILNKLYFARRK